MLRPRLKKNNVTPFPRRAAHEGEPRPAPHKGIYLLPNAFTTAALFCGFYAIVMAMNSKFEYAAIAIFCSMVLDGMDGRVARLTNTQSAWRAIRQLGGYGQLWRCTCFGDV